MTLRPAFVAALFALSALVPTAASAQVTPDCSCDADLGAVYEAVQPSIVRVHTREGRGSGFFIAPDQVVTAWDVADVRRDLRVETSDGQMLSAEPLTRGDGIAVLRLPEAVIIDGAPAPALTLAPTPPAVGERIFAIGRQGGPSASPMTMMSGDSCGGGAQFAFTDGIVSEVGEGTFQTTAVSPGGAGAPLLDSKGQVVGVVTRAGGSLSRATQVGNLQSVVAAEPSLPRAPSLEAAHRYGAAFSRITGLEQAEGGHFTLQAGWEAVIARRFLLGFDFEADWLLDRDAREKENQRSQRLVMAGRFGPRIEMPFNPAFPVPFAVQPYAQIGATTSRTGVRTETMTLRDPGCDMATEACGVDVERGIDWQDWRWAPSFGGGLRFDTKGIYIDVGAATNPWNTKRDTRFVVGFGIRFATLRR